MAFRNEKFYTRYVYDFAVSGGSTGDIALSSVDGFNSMPLYCVITNVIAVVRTAFTSGGSATLAVGNATDRDGYIVAQAVAALVDNYAVMSNGALLFDDTNDINLAWCADSANDCVFSVSIATAAMTAGKAEFLVEAWQPVLD